MSISAVVCTDVLKSSARKLAIIPRVECHEIFGGTPSIFSGTSESGAGNKARLDLVLELEPAGVLDAAAHDRPAVPAGRCPRPAAVHRRADEVILAAATSRIFEGGEVLQNVLEMDNGFLFLMSISDGRSFAVLAARNCDVGQVGYEMALMVDGQVDNSLPPPDRTGGAGDRAAGEPRRDPPASTLGSATARSAT